MEKGKDLLVIEGEEKEEKDVGEVDSKGEVVDRYAEWVAPGGPEVKAKLRDGEKTNEEIE